MNQFANKDIEEPENFPAAERVLTVIRTGTGAKQAWAMLDEAIASFQMTPPFAIVQNNKLKKMKQFSAGRVPVFVH